MKNGWLLYDDCDLAVNRDFAAFFTQTAAARGLAMETVRLSELSFGLGDAPGLFLARAGRAEKPDFVVSRQRDALVSEQFERLGVPVFNCARACAACNDKRRTHQLLAGAGVPMLPTLFGRRACVAPPERYPAIVKPARGHGGDRVRLVRSADEFTAAVAAITPTDDYLVQRVASEAGRDLRVYVLFGEIVTGVLRTARTGVISNFKLGGDVALHEPDPAERALARRVIDAFAAAGAPLAFAGVDLLYDQGRPVLSEVEDVVGSRMLYKVGGPDIVALYTSELAKRI